MGDDLIDEAVFLGLLRRKEVVALGIQLHLFQRLAGVLAEQPVHLGAGADEMVGMDLDVGSLSGQATDIKIHADHLVRTRAKMNRLLSEYTGQPLEKVELDTERDNFLSAQEAKEYGLIDEVITHR